MAERLQQPPLSEQQQVVNHHSVLLESARQNVYREAAQLVEQHGIAVGHQRFDKESGINAQLKMLAEARFFRSEEHALLVKRDLAAPRYEGLALGAARRIASSTLANLPAQSVVNERRFLMGWWPGQDDKTGQVKQSFDHVVDRLVAAYLQTGDATLLDTFARASTLPTVSSDHNRIASAAEFAKAKYLNNLLLATRNMQPEQKAVAKLRVAELAYGLGFTKIVEPAEPMKSPAENVQVSLATVTSIEHAAQLSRRNRRIIGKPVTRAAVVVTGAILAGAASQGVAAAETPANSPDKVLYVQDNADFTSANSMSSSSTPPGAEAVPIAPASTPPTPDATPSTTQSSSPSSSPTTETPPPAPTATAPNPVVVTGDNAPTAQMWNNGKPTVETPASQNSDPVPVPTTTPDSSSSNQQEAPPAPVLSDGVPISTAPVTVAANGPSNVQSTGEAVQFNAVRTPASPETLKALALESQGALYNAVASHLRDHHDAVAAPKSNPLALKTSAILAAYDQQLNTVAPHNLARYRQASEIIRLIGRYPGSFDKAIDANDDTIKRLITESANTTDIDPIFANKVRAGVENALGEEDAAKLSPRELQILSIAAAQAADELTPRAAPKEGQVPIADYSKSPYGIIKSAVSHHQAKKQSTPEVLHQAGSRKEAALDAMEKMGPEWKNRAIVMRFMMKHGFTAFQAAGQIGNACVEAAGCELHASIHQRGGPAVGFIQWEGGRKDNLYKYANRTNQRWDSIHTQLGFMLEEYHTYEHSAYERLKATKNVHDASYVVLNYFERPAARILGLRLDHAKETLNMYDKLLRQAHGTETVAFHRGHAESKQHTADVPDDIGQRVQFFARELGIDPHNIDVYTGSSGIKHFQIKQAAWDKLGIHSPYAGYAQKYVQARLDAYVDPYGMYSKECVSFAAWMVAHDNFKGGMPHWGGHGNAMLWDSNARNAGIPVNHKLTTGSVIQWDTNGPEHNSFGHVAYVVDGRGSWGVYAEANYDGNGGFDVQIMSPQNMKMNHDQIEVLHFEKGKQGHGVASIQPKHPTKSKPIPAPQPQSSPSTPSTPVSSTTPTVPFGGSGDTSSVPVSGQTSETPVVTQTPLDETLGSDNGNNGNHGNSPVWDGSDVNVHDNSVVGLINQIQ